MLKAKLEGDLSALENFLKLMAEIANYWPCADKNATLLEQVLAIKPQKGTVMVYSRYDHKWEATYAKLDENVETFLQKHKHETVVRIKGYSISFTSYYKKITVRRLFKTPENFDSDRAWNLEIEVSLLFSN
jgi:hypothetical protein